MARSIADFYRDRSVLLTGATGFVGKVILEKLLRTAPHVRTVYVLCRSKKNRTARERVDRILNERLFANLNRATDDGWKKKIVAIDGDLTAIDLGLSPCDRRALQATVTIVVHAAATVQFNETFVRSVLTNVRGTRDVCRLSLRMDALAAFVYVSTAYSYSNRTEIDERVYAPPIDWRAAIAYCESSRDDDDAATETVARKLIGDYLNYYTYSKAIAENVVVDHCRGRVPTFIVRPSVVLPAIDEPLPGWIDGYGGSSAICMASGKGLLRTLPYSDAPLNMVPVDVVARIALLVPYHHHHHRRRRRCTERNEPHDVHVYNACGRAEDETDIRTLTATYVRGAHVVPLERPLGYPHVVFPRSRLVHSIEKVAYHLVPALVVDGFVRLTGKRPFLLRLQSKVNAACDMLLPFVTKRWLFRRGNVDGLIECYASEPIAGYDLRIKDYLAEENVTNAIYCAKRHVLNERMDLDADRRYLKRMKLLHDVFRSIWRSIALFCCYLLLLNILN